MYDTLHAPATGTGPAQEFLGSRELTPTPNPRLESVMYLSAAPGTILKEKQPCGVHIHVAINVHNPTCMFVHFVILITQALLQFEFDSSFLIHFIFVFLKLFTQ